MKCLHKHPEACSWQPDSHLSNTIAPKWNLQTPKERQEHEDTVKKLGKYALIEIMAHS